MKKLKNGSVLLLLTAMLLPAWSVAQDDDAAPTWLIVRSVTTHAGQEDIWAEQQRRLAAAHKERGDSTRHVWEEISGNLNTFHIVSFPDQIGGGGGQGGPNADPPMGDGQDVWFATTGPTIDARSSMILRNFPALSIPPAEGSEPGLLILRRTTVAPGRSGDYNDWLSEHLVPALKKAGATGVNFNRLFSGGDTNLWISGSRVASMAEFTGPGPLASLSGEERAAVFGALGEGVIWQSERMLLRFRDDLSHVTVEEEE
jgi:hypothetical protein